jgi:hypothetical protein
MPGIMNGVAIAVRWICVALFLLSVGCFAWMLFRGKAHPDNNDALIFLGALFAIAAIVLGVVDSALGRFRTAGALGARLGNDARVQQLLGKGERIVDWFGAGLVAVLFAALSIWTFSYLPLSVRHFIRHLF